MNFHERHQKEKLVSRYIVPVQWFLLRINIRDPYFEGLSVDKSNIAQWLHLSWNSIAL